MRRGVYTEVKLAKTPENPLPLLHTPVGGCVEPEYDDDEEAVRKYAKENPMEDADDAAEEIETSMEGGESLNASSVPQPEQPQGDQTMEEMETFSQPKRHAGDLRLLIPVKQRVAETEASK